MSYSIKAVDDFMSQFICKLCGYQFTRPSTLQQHISMKRCPALKQDTTQERKKNKISEKEIINKEVLRQVNEIVLGLKSEILGLKNDMKTENQELKKEIHKELKNEIHQELKSEIQEITKNSLQTQVFNQTQVLNQTHVFNQNLQVMCVNSNENFLDVLSSRLNVMDALAFIKDCALSRLAGDCRLLEKVYFNGGRPPIMAMNSKKKEFIYYDENNKRVFEKNPKVLGQKLADCLQRTYLKSICYFQSRKKPSDLKIDPIESYDISDWNEHIHVLSDVKYQKKILERLKIPLVADAI